MSLDAAQRYAWNLACTLKVIIILIATDNGYRRGAMRCSRPASSR